jgi:hypothetical protein
MMAAFGAKPVNNVVTQEKTCSLDEEAVAARAEGIAASSSAIFPI